MRGGGEGLRRQPGRRRPATGDGDARRGRGADWVGVAGGADVGCQEGARSEGDRSPAEAKERPPALSSDSDNVYSESVDSDNG